MLITHVHTFRTREKGNLVSYAPGEEFELPDKIAKEKIAAGLAKRAGKAKGRGSRAKPEAQTAEDRANAIGVAVLDLDPKNGEHYADEVPLLSAVQAVLGDDFPDVTQEELDAALGVMQA